MLGRLQILDKEQMYRVHRATLKVLENTCPMAREKLLGVIRNNGADVGLRSGMVWLPARLVKEAISRYEKGARQPPQELVFTA